ncbi:ABC transporter substrate-binding protein [Pelobium sp.]|nr:ABC transporter substrate-binding protein [Pelobium sp.]MDA9555632.1 ABC transporter substrate-binding protein [Pelobium sp.]
MKRQTCLLFHVIVFTFLFKSVGFADELKSVTLQLKWRNQFQFAGYYAAKIKGFYKAVGLDVSIKPGGYGISPIEEVKSGRADIGIYDPDIILQKDGNVPLVALANIMQSSPYVIITLPNKHILKPTDLIGKRVLSAGDQGWNIFKAILYREGIKSDLIKIIPRQKDSEEIIEDKGDAVITYSSTQPQRLRFLGYKPVLIKPVEYGIDFYGDVLFSTQRFAYSDQKTTDAFIEATKKGWEYAFNHEDELIDYIYALPGEKGYSKKEFLKYEAKELRKLIMPDIVEIGHMNLGRWKYMLDIYKESGITNQDISLKGFLYEPEKSEFSELIKPLLYGTGVIVSLIIIISVINWQLRKQVKIRTTELQKEIEIRKQAEELAKQSIQQIELILDNANIGTWEFDLATRKTHINEKFVETFMNYLDQNQEDFDFNSIIHPEDVENVKNNFNERLEGRLSKTPTKFRILGSNNEYFTILSSSRLLYRDNKPYKLSGALVNIEPILKKEKELLKLSEELMQSNNELKKFAYIVSHNLRGPVVNINSLFKMIDHDAMSDENKMYCEKIEISIKKLDNTLNDLIEIVSHQRPENKSLTVIDFKQALQEVVDSIESQVFLSKAQIRTNFEVKTMVYSKKYFESILLNLLTNAIKYKSSDRALEINLSTSENDEYIIFKVQDNGIGIDLEKNKNKIFGLYQRFNPNVEGKGIGLFIIKSHIESLSGKIEVESSINVGTTFTIYFSKNLIQKISLS